MVAARYSENGIAELGDEIGTGRAPVPTRLCRPARTTTLTSFLVQTLR
ncbi:MAG: hypothetical protein F6K30_10050 [Cyanothece sp. SIO2G6]|nr:hypothetical protein [Cyanothece sp. SIO2G6]